ncbi:hypothetical protein PUNSTDRAFT_42281 [Punctularia strigosozonata HHB-11173 SS5]|uniref:uncharacterized protein n=1 Tax=Punctularia strigosozonata (strain HHB-11173) TaxID=741275 RepID=UPI000441687B|nr:uncharacterized protein PUNSTDRAFT_42281 [Punctularia strigosozonata HHB-11173 SS5]EIN12786.1 hypothetical protein PUNSTDRAFT_42281 [Punctularia strigosozonata HHB-11173 SS5]
MALYTLQITFHSALNLPIGDIHTLSIDPFIEASLDVPTFPRERDDPPLTFRTPSLHSTRDPTWDAVWVVSGIPSEGFLLKMNVKDEDPSTIDDRAGQAVADFRKAGVVRDGFEVKMGTYDIRKRSSSPQMYVQTALLSILPCVKMSLHGRVIVSIRCLGKAPNQNTRRAYTLGPNKWTQHFSPLVGYITASRHAPPSTDPDVQSALQTTTGTGRKLSASTFIANRLQLTGPVPDELRHRYVGYRPFIDWMFQRSGIRGRILNRGLRKQYRTIYSYDSNTKYGVVERSEHEEDRFSKEFALQFLKMVSFGTGGRLFTYVITLDGEWRFTETGEEFAVQMLSKHGMHADLAKEVAFSGEFFVRPVVNEAEVGKGGGFKSGSKVADGSITKEVEEKKRKEEEDKEKQAQDHDDKKESKAKQLTKKVKGPEREVEEMEAKEEQKKEEQKEEEKDEADPRIRKLAGEDPEEILQDPAVYELVIDNDSGTYRPRLELLPVLREWLGSPERLGALGRITCVDGFDEDLQKAKEARTALRKKKKGVKDGERVAMPRRGSSLSSIDSGVLGQKEKKGVLGSMHVGKGKPSIGRSVSSGEIEKALKEHADQAGAEVGGSGAHNGEAHAYDGAKAQNGDAHHPTDQQTANEGERDATAPDPGTDTRNESEGPTAEPQDEPLKSDNYDAPSSSSPSS